MTLKLRLRHSVFLVVFFIFFLFPAGGQASLISSKHNLSVSGPGELKALTETRICIFCHTPHNGAPQTPLWNRSIGPVNYTLYESETLLAVPSQPKGPSRLCLSCHDGLIALGALLTGKVETTGEITPARRSYIGTNLADDHPVSFSYINSMAGNSQIVSPPPSDPRLIFYGDYNVECSTCHDAHDDSHCARGSDCKFLVMDNRFSALCVECHNMTGWLNSEEVASSATWNGIPPNPWPHTDWLTVGENGCENCHRPHSAGGPEWLLNYSAEEWNCYPCHNGHVASKNVQAEFEKISHHPVEATMGVHSPKENPLVTDGHVECSDCHDAHAYNNRTAEAPYVSGATDNVVGISKDGIAVSPAQYQYEICFRCHADTASGVAYIPRVIDETNTRTEFSLNNPSFHPVEGPRNNPNVPSIPSTYMPTLTTSSIIYCTDCHDSDDSPAIGGSGAQGPHGSSIRPLLRERYETLDNTNESYQNYALCYRCHERNSILANQSFKLDANGKGGHSGHLQAGAPCSICHDPHGVASSMTPGTGDHTNLINFDSRYVTPVSGQTYPFFTAGSTTFSGSCTLVCHGVVHTSSNSSYQ